MPSTPGQTEPLDPQRALQVDQLCESFEAAWKRGESPQIEAWVLKAEASLRPLLLRELQVVELALRKAASDLATKDTHDTNGKNSSTIAAPQPATIGRYRIERVLGKGGFGLVYLAHDQQLQRHVAIKVAHRERVSTAAEAEAYLTEARTVANLDHPQIVPVHDVGSTAEFPYFIVSKFIEGSTLAERIQSDRPKPSEAAELVAAIAEALHYAHGKGLVHQARQHSD